MTRTRKHIIEDLENCSKLLLQLKANYAPGYRELMITWVKRRDELKAELEDCVMLKLLSKNRQKLGIRSNNILLVSEKETQTGDKMRVVSVLVGEPGRQYRG